MQTPWGPSQTTQTIGDHIVRVTTAGHGGYYVPPSLYRMMPAALRTNPYGTGTWFEEDCEWALVALAFPDHFQPRQIRNAVETIKVYSQPTETYHAAYRWLMDTTMGQCLRIIAQGYDTENGAKWECGCEGTHPGGWFASLTRIRDRAKQTRIFREVCRQQFYTDAELDALSITQEAWQAQEEAKQAVPVAA